MGGYAVGPISRPDGDAIHAQEGPVAVVGLHQRAHGVGPPPVSTSRDAVPMPPLKSWQIMPVPPPTLPSATGPPAAESKAAWTCLP